MDKVLVTGAGGYIGQHLTLALVADGWLVRGFGRSPCPPNLTMIEWVQGDICTTDDLAVAIRDCRAVIHLACLPLALSNQNPIEAHRVNGEGTLATLQAAQDADIEIFIYASTGQVYSGQSSLPNKETDLAFPSSAYGASKLCGEVWCRTFARTSNMTIYCLRLFNVHGTAADGSLRSTVESNFIRQLVQHQRPCVQGHPKDGRDFIHIDDVVRAFQLALSRRIGCHTLNIGTGICTTLTELALMSARLVGSNMDPEHRYSMPYPTRFCADRT